MYNSILVKQNLTNKNKEKLLKILQNTIKPDEEILIIKNENESNDISEHLKDNLQYNYLLLDLDANFDKEVVLDYLNKHFITNLQQFLEQKGYNLTKAPVNKIQQKNMIDDIDLEGNEISFGFLNLMEVNNKKTILSKETIEEFENYLNSKLNMLFDINFNKLEEKEFKNLLKQAQQEQQLNKKIEIEKLNEEDIKNLKEIKKELIKIFNKFQLPDSVFEDIESKEHVNSILKQLKQQIKTGKYNDILQKIKKDNLISIYLKVNNIFDNILNDEQVLSYKNEKDIEDVVNKITKIEKEFEIYKMQQAVEQDKQLGHF